MRTVILATDHDAAPVMLYTGGDRARYVGNVRRAADGAWIGTSAINGRIVSQRGSEEAAMSDVAEYWVKWRERARVKRRRNA